MQRPNRWNGVSNDAVLCAVFALGAVAVSVASVPAAASALVVGPFLLAIPGHAMTIAVFPWGAPDGTGAGGDRRGGLPVIDRLLLAVATSVALAVIVGVNLEWTTWPIRLRTVVGVLAALTVTCVAIGVVRRRRHPVETPETRPGVSVLPEPTRGSTVATLAVTVAVLGSLLTVAAVGGAEQRGERYTEFGLLTETDSGELVATGYPDDLTVGESTTLSYTITNREKRPADYVVLVQLVEIDDDGDTLRRTQLRRFEERLHPDETKRLRHTVTPTVEGDGLRLTYLLYRSEPPARPSSDSAYRDLHIWVDVTAGTDATS
jgi:uncharacterized membrane protein